MTVGTAVAVLVGILALATVLGRLLRRRTGRAVPAGSRTGSDGPRADDLAPESDYGSAATLVQFSTPTCARCPATRRHLDALAARHDGVARLEIDLAERPDLATRFNVMQTPTVLLLDADRSVHTRFGGPPRPPELAAALDTVLATSATGPQESR
ncbi:TlpA family protein disulfide reductase [Curtobacterium flaccumfaciens pv. flaccumfaciens]|uniref:TlpA family protein disulfide reductase n=1 Tax=Curtobacterium flaccumfaciens TaxID=2035 RepID=UPI00399FC6AE